MKQALDTLFDAILSITSIVEWPRLRCSVLRKKHLNASLCRTAGLEIAHKRMPVPMQGDITYKNGRDSAIAYPRVSLHYER